MFCRFAGCLLSGVSPVTAFNVFFLLATLGRNPRGIEIDFAMGCSS